MFEHPVLKTVICNSRLVADEVAQFYQVPAEKLRVIYNGVDGDVFHPELALEFREKVRAAHRIPNEAPLLLFVGSGFERKGIPALLAAFAQMTRSDARLVVVGADRKLNAMRALAQKLNIAERVIFTGPLKDVRPWYGAADAFVLPTLYDPCPNAALEALSAGLPSLVSNSCGAAEFIQTGGNGDVCDALDITQMTIQLDALCELSKDAHAKTSARAAVSHLTLPGMAAELLALYQQL
jgi:UDP-glucose:(heptosyl)LPS alpha-1,3-glucosyltransferase